MSILRQSREKLNNWVETRLRRVLQMSGRHNSAPDDPFLKLQWMIKHESGLIQDLLIKTSPALDEWRSAGYSVYSQFDEDGLIQHLLRHVKVDRDHFVEIGIEDYRQSNTRYLLTKDNWTGTIVDCVPSAEAFLNTFDLRTQYSVDFVESLVTVENINSLLADQGEIGLFSLDIDSMDYFVFEAMTARPSIVILEYMATYGPDADVSVPFRNDFNRYTHHYSGLCVGASLAAMTRLANAKGYALVGCSQGHNAFYVRRDLLGSVKEVTAHDSIGPCRYRDSRGPDGAFTLVTSMDKRREAMRDAVVFDFKVGAERTIAEVYGL